MLHDHGGAVGVGSKLVVEPGHLVGRDLSVRATRDCGVEADQPEFVVVHDEIDPIVGVAHRQSREASADLAAVVVITGDRQQRCGDGVEYRGEIVVLRR